MIFQEVGPNENLDVRRFSSASFGLWEAGILKMGWVTAKRPGPLEAFPWDVQTDEPHASQIISRAGYRIPITTALVLSLVHEYVKGASGGLLEAISSPRKVCAHLRAPRL